MSSEPQVPPVTARPVYRFPALGATASTAWSVWALLLGMGMLMLGNGMQVTLLGLRASVEGFSATVTGFVMSGYFVGFLGGAFLTPIIIQRAGHVRVFAAMASIASVAILVHAMFVIPVVWGLMRLVTGFSYSGLYIVTESWLNDRATNEVRGRLLSVYLIIVFVGMAGGQLTMNLASPKSYDLFLLNAIIVSLALVPILLTEASEPDRSSPDPMSLKRLYKLCPLGTLGILATGASHGALFSMAAVYAHDSGMSVAQVSMFMTALIAGGAALQWPIGRLSDRIDRRKVIAGTGLMVAVIAAATGLFAGHSNTALITIALLFGGGVLPMYSLYLAYVNDHLAPRQMVAASSKLYIVAAVGSVVGPPVTGWLMDLRGPGGFLWYFVVVHLVMVVYALYLIASSESVVAEEQSPYAPMPGRTGELMETWVEEVAEVAETRQEEAQS
ncbi:MAG: MFS transporter [Arenicellales bacterium]